MLKANKYKFSEVPQQYWDFAHKYGTIYQSKPYLSCLAASGRELLIIEVDDGDEIVGGAGFILNRKILNFAYSANSTLGPVVEDTKRTADVLECVAKALKSSCFQFGIVVWPDYAENLADNLDMSKWSAQEFESLHWDISGSMDSLWKQLAKGKKSGINRGRREGVVIEKIETVQQLRHFHDLYTMSMVRSRLLPQPLEHYENLISVLRPKGLMEGFLALHPKTKQPIATRMLLLGMQHGEATFMASGHDYEFRKLQAPDFLTWHCIEYLKSRGIVMVDFQGLPKDGSPRAEGIRNYKLAWAGDNGRRCPSFVLSRANFGINPKFLQKASGFPKKVVKSVMKLVKG